MGGSRRKYTKHLDVPDRVEVRINGEVISNTSKNQVFVSLGQGKNIQNPPKTNMIMGNPPSFEDVSPIENDDFLMSC